MRWQTLSDGAGALQKTQSEISIWTVYVLGIFK